MKIRIIVVPICFYDQKTINKLVENTIYGDIEICQFMRYNNIYQLIVLMNTSCQKLVVYMKK